MIFITIFAIVLTGYLLCTGKFKALAIIAIALALLYKPSRSINENFVFMYANFLHGAILAFVPWLFYKTGKVIFSSKKSISPILAKAYKKYYVVHGTVIGISSTPIVHTEITTRQGVLGNTVVNAYNHVSSYGYLSVKQKDGTIDTIEGEGVSDLAKVGDEVGYGGHIGQQYNIFHNVTQSTTASAITPGPVLTTVVGLIYSLPFMGQLMAFVFFLANLFPQNAKPMMGNRRMELERSYANYIFLALFVIPGLAFWWYAESGLGNDYMLQFFAFTMSYCFIAGNILIHLLRKEYERFDSFMIQKVSDAIMGRNQNSGAIPS